MPKRTSQESSLDAALCFRRSPERTSSRCHTSQLSAGPTRPAAPEAGDARSEPLPNIRIGAILVRLVALLLGLAAVPAGAQTAENVEGLGPEDGAWELEYVGQVGNAKGSRDKRQHSGQSFYGVTDWLALGGETQLSYRARPDRRSDRLYFDYDSAIGIFRFSDPEADPVGLGLWIQAGLDMSDGELARLEARLIADRRTASWRGQANLMLRRINEGRQEGVIAAYALRLRHRILGSTWAGVETSGQMFELSGFNLNPLDKGHYLGPNVMHRFEIGRENNLDLQVSYLHRLDKHQGLRNLLQVSGTLRF